MIVLHQHIPMQLRISCIDKVVFEWEVKEVTLPTEIGDVKILPWHTPMVTALKPWILSINQEKKWETSISIGKWMVFVDGKIIRIATSSATTKANESKEDLEKKKYKLEEYKKELRKKWSIEKIEETLIQLEKINADQKLKKLK